MPSTAGIRTSIRTTSAPVRRTTGRTSAPSPASPTTVRSGSALMIARSPLRISGSSSTTTTDSFMSSLRRHADRQPDREAPGLPVVLCYRTGVHRAAQYGDSFTDSGQAAAAAGVPRPAVHRIGDRESQPGRVQPDRQLDGELAGRTTGVPDRVGQAFLHDAVRLPGDRGRKLVEIA